MAAPRLCIVRYFRFSSFNRPQIPLDYSSVESASWAFFSLPIRYRQRGHCLQGHRLTSALLPQQQSRHLSRIALPLVILSSIFPPYMYLSSPLPRRFNLQFLGVRSEFNRFTVIKITSKHHQNCLHFACILIPSKKYARKDCWCVCIGK